MYFCLVGIAPNQSVHGKYTLISVWFDKIWKRFLCAHTENNFVRREEKATRSNYGPSNRCELTHFRKYFAMGDTEHELSLPKYLRKYGHFLRLQWLVESSRGCWCEIFLLGLEIIFYHPSILYTYIYIYLAYIYICIYLIYIQYIYLSHMISTSRGLFRRSFAFAFCMHAYIILSPNCYI